MESTKPKNKTRNLIITVCAAVVVVVVALVVFMNVNTQRIIDQNTQYLETSTNQTVRRVNDTFSSSLQSVQTAAVVYGDAISDEGFNPRTAATILDNAQFDHIFFIDAQGTAYNNDGATADATDREYYIEGVQGKSGMCYVDSTIFDGQNAVVFYAPVVLDNEVIGIMASVLREESLTEVMTTEFYGQSTPTYLCERDGTMVAMSGSVKPDARDIDEIFIARGLNEEQLAVLDVDIAEGNTVSFTYDTSEGTGNTFVTKLPDFDWMLVRSFPASITNEMLLRANTSGFILVGGVLLAAIVVIVVLTMQARRENQELLLERQEATRIIDASTNLFDSLFTVDLEKHTYEFLKNDSQQKSIPPRGNASDLRQFFDKIIDKNSLSTDAHEKFDKDNIASILTPGVRFIQEEWRTNDRENPCWYQASILCLARDAQGKPTSVLVAIQDVTDAKAEELRAHIALEDAFKAAEHASQAKSDFLNSMSHDIRTPMNSIMGLTAIAGMHVNDPERVRECLTNITSASRHLLGLINEVLDMAKIESGSIDLAEEPFDLSEPIENLITMMNPQIAAKHQELKVELVDIKHEHVLGDPTRLQQVFVNIMGNSVKFTPEGGTIGLRITELPSSIQSSACYEFEFSDTGCGMSEEFMKRLFEPFSRANDSRTTKVEGTGLGMAIVKSVVSLMSGTIDVESKEGEGTTFTVVVHMKLRDAEQEDLSDLEGIPVLVVDDDEVACEGACILLDDIGMKSEFRLSGPAGIEAVKSRLDNDPYRVVILDWRMPGMSGLEAAKHIREATNEAVPIIILSAYDWSMIEQEARQVGVDAFISKPLFRSRLVQVMKELLVGEMKSVIDEKAMLEELAFQGKRVLLTEDNPMAAEIARELVEMTGADVEHAENGKLALDMLLEHEPGYYDIVLMDIQMPVMNGHEAASAIRAQADKRPDMGQIPIVALSADAFAEDVRHARSAGMNDHMSKPLEIETLVRMLKKWVS